MNAKWYIGALVVILTFFGASQEQLPNQEIVLQFSKSNVSSQETQLAIANVKSQLKAIGIEKIAIANAIDGRVIITYHSNKNVANIKDMLSDKAQLSLNVSTSTNKNLPKESFDDLYNVDVFEITKNSDTGFGSTGKIIFELKQDYDRFSNPNHNGFATLTKASENTIAVSVAYKVNATIAIAIQNIAYKIPEGRAGPLA